MYQRTIDLIAILQASINSALMFAYIRQAEAVPNVYANR
jgi:hypothetical protein